MRGTVSHDLPREAMPDGCSTETLERLRRKHGLLLGTPWPWGVSGQPAAPAPHPRLLDLGLQPGLQVCRCLCAWPAAPTEGRSAAPIAQATEGEGTAPSGVELLFCRLVLGKVEIRLQKINTSFFFKFFICFS